MTQKELNKILKKHKLWLERKRGGVLANLKNENLYNLDFKGSDLSYAILENAKLVNVNLSKATLDYANLIHANIINTDLSHTSLFETNLMYSNLKDTNLSYSHISRVMWQEATLININLKHTSLHHINCENSYWKNINLNHAYILKLVLCNAQLEDICFKNAYYCHFLNMSNAFLKNCEDIPYMPELDICPSHGSFIGWNLVKNINDKKKYIVKLEIPKDAKRSSSTGRKCRSDKAKVLAICDLKGNETNIKIIANKDTTYEVEQMIYDNNFDENRWNEHTDGIHFYITLQEVINKNI